MGQFFVAGRAFPKTRMRRLRRHDFLRESTLEHRIDASDLIQPLFVCEDHMLGEFNAGLPGLNRTGFSDLPEKLESIRASGITMVMMFAVIEAHKKTPDGIEASNEKGILARSIRLAVAQQPDLGIVTDVALDPFTSHGHDGVLSSQGGVDNDQTLKHLERQALMQADAGSHVLAPSDMMDGRVGVIREALEKNGFVNTSIMSYAVKYHSCFYGPFRQAANSMSSLKGGNKADYQMHPANSDEAVYEAMLDIQEGADLLIVKPGMPYLDVLSRIAKQLKVPTYAYQVSGEYAMLMNAAQQGIFDAKSALLESLIAFKRAGARGIISYHALDMAQSLSK